MNLCRVKKFFIIIFLFLLLLYNFPILIEKVYDAKEIRLAVPSYIESCQIYISGYYYFNLFSKDMFKGQIKISDNPLTEEKMTDIVIDSDGDALEYSFQQGHDEYDNPIMMYYGLGLLFSKPLMYNVCILAYSDDSYDKYGNAKTHGSWGGWSSLDGFCIVSSVNNRHEALEVLYEYGLISTIDGK